MCAGPLCTRSFRTYAVQASLSIYQYFLSYSTYTMSSIINWLIPRMHCHNSHTNTEFNTFEYPTKKSGLFFHSFWAFVFNYIVLNSASSISFKLLQYIQDQSKFYQYIFSFIFFLMYRITQKHYKCTIHLLLAIVSTSFK